MKRDYPELEGKVIEYVNPDFPEIKSALVVGVNYDIGITLVNAEDKSDYLFCLTGPGAPRWKECDGTESERTEYHKKIFALVLKMIKAGKYKEERMDVVYKSNPIGHGNNPGVSTCSFAA